MKALQFMMIATVFVAAGCESSSKTATAGWRSGPDVMDLNSPPPSAHPPLAPAPMTPSAPMADSTAAPMPASSTEARKHVVAAKDTLYSLAQKYYGDSKQWPKIVAANPGLVPEKMPIGKTITIP